MNSHGKAIFSIVPVLLLAACDLGIGGGEISRTSPATEMMQSPTVAIAKGRVDIEGGVIRLAARRDGVITEVLVEEGARVKKGDVLAQLEDNLIRLNLDVERRQLDERRAAIPQLQVQLRAAERELARLEKLLAIEAAPRQELDQARDQVQLVTTDLRRAEAAIASAQAQINVTEFEIEQRKVRAPLDGRIIQRQARPGNGVSTLNVTPLFLFAPDVPRIVRAQLEERFVPRVAPGMPAEVSMEADLSKRSPAKVLRVGQVYGAKTPSDDPTERSDVRVVEIVLSIEDQSMLIGQRVLVKVAPEQASMRQSSSGETRS